MEKEIFPKIDLFPRLSKVARVLGSFYLGREVKNTGGGPFIDNQVCPDEVDIPEYTQLMLDHSTNEP